jgi:1-aminocyclopropane-1-carboxylate synthase
VKALLLCNPCNPTGRIYTKEEYAICCEFCLRHRIHIICDEVYALTVYEDGGFTSWATLTRRRGLSKSLDVGQGKKDDSDSGPSDSFFSDYMHFLWSLSKDFCGSGMRVGVLYSRNRELVRACGGMNDMSMISNIAQQVLQPVLSNHLWVEGFLDTNRTRLRECYKTLVSGLAELFINVCPAEGGLFIFADLRSLFLQEPKTMDCHVPSKDINDPCGFYSQEIELESRLRKMLIFATPGRACHCQIPGWFRLCYGWTSLAAVTELVSRLAAESRRVREFRKEVEVESENAASIFDK